MLRVLRRYTRGYRAFRSTSCTNSKRRRRKSPRAFPTEGFPRIDPSQPIEEERLPWYDPKDFYPVRIGDVYKRRYQVTGKLGYGAYPTVWLCRDLL